MNPLPSGDISSEPSPTNKKVDEESYNKAVDKLPTPRLPKEIPVNGKSDEQTPQTKSEENKEDKPEKEYDVNGHLIKETFFTFDVSKKKNYIDRIKDYEDGKLIRETFFCFLFRTGGRNYINKVKEYKDDKLIKETFFNEFLDNSISEVKDYEDGKLIKKTSFRYLLLRKKTYIKRVKEYKGDKLIKETIFDTRKSLTQPSCIKIDNYNGIFTAIYYNSDGSVKNRAIYLRDESIKDEIVFRSEVNRR